MLGLSDVRWRCVCSCCRVSSARANLTSTDALLVLLGTGEGMQGSIDASHWMWSSLTRCEGFGLAFPFMDQCFASGALTRIHVGAIPRARSLASYVKDMPLI